MLRDRQLLCIGAMILIILLVSSSTSASLLPAMRVEVGEGSRKHTIMLREDDSRVGDVSDLRVPVGQQQAYSVRVNSFTTPSYWGGNRWITTDGKNSNIIVEQTHASSGVSIISFWIIPDYAPINVGDNFTYIIEVKNVDTKPIYLLPISRESFDPSNSVSIVEDLRPFIIVDDRKLNPGEVAIAGPFALFKAEKPGEVSITVGVFWSYEGSPGYYEVTATFTFIVYGAQAETYTITFLTDPPGVGSITFAGTAYTDGQSSNYVAGTYSVRANVPQGYVFDSWFTLGGVFIADPEAPTTTATVAGEGYIIAVFKWPVKFRGTVISHLHSDGWPAIEVRIDELLLDTANRLRVGERIRVYRQTPFTEINVGNRVEVYGLGFWRGYHVEHGVVIKYPEHYIRKIEAAKPPELTLFTPEIRGLTVTINGVTTPGTPGTFITRIHWDWGDGYSEDRWFPASHTYSRAGTYTITVTSYQSDGLSTTKSVTVTLVTFLPDLTITSVTASPSEVYIGGELTVSWNERNQGNANAGEYVVGIYLGRIEYGRDYKIGVDHSSGLAAGGSRSQTLRFSIPQTVPPGQYFVTVFIDETGRVAESNENNNIGSTTPNSVTIKEVDVTKFVKISVGIAPFNRIFDIDLTITNHFAFRKTFKIVLEERSGFQAGEIYGDGDEVKSISLAPNEKRTVNFKAKVYGVPRTGDLARFKVYDEEGRLLDKVEHRISLKPEFTEITSVLSPLSIRKGTEFSIGLPVFYSLSYNTYMELELRSVESGRTLSIKDMLNGEGLKFYTFRVNNTLVELGSEGIRSFEVTIRLYYPEENYKMAFEKKFTFSVRISDAIGKASIIPDSNFRVVLNYGGKKYVAVWAYNATYVESPKTGDYKDVVNWAYSQRNWLVFEMRDRDLKPIMDDELYKTLTSASEVAYLRAGSWNNDYLFTRSKFFGELRNLAIVLEALNFIAEISGKLVGIIISKGVSSWASSVTSGFEAGERVGDVTLTVARTVKILEKVGLHTQVLKAINEGAKGEEILVWTAIFMLNGGSENLDEANKLLTGIPPFSTVIEVDVNEALRFYDLVQLGETLGLASMHFLSTFYPKDEIEVMGYKLNVRAFKNALLEAIPFVGDPVKFYFELGEIFNLSPEAFKFGRQISELWERYEIPKEIMQINSIKFRDKFISETKNSMVITLTEPLAQKKLYLTVFDDKGGLVGLNKASGVIEADIAGSYYFDFGNIVKIILPVGTEIKKIVVDATKAELPVENYTLSVQIYKDGHMVASTEKSEEVKKEALKEYHLQVDEKGNIEVIARAPPPVEPNLPPPGDLDNDGLFEDVNGNGRLDFDDVVKFFKHFDNPVISDFSEFYDFNRNGRLDFGDVVELYKKVGG